MNDPVQTFPATQPSAQATVQSTVDLPAEQLSTVPPVLAQQQPVIVTDDDQLTNNNQSAVNNQSTVNNQISDDDQSAENLAVFESVLDEIQSSVPHGVVQAVDQATDTLNPQRGSTRSAKEAIEPSTALDAQAIDISSGMQAIEQEKNPEIPVEVESFLQRVEDHHETAPTEVVIADGTSEVPSNAYPSQPVIVLPITQSEEKEGAKKSPKFSFRWLVEFSHKIVKMFTGKVIYRQDKV